MHPEGMSDDARSAEPRSGVSELRRGLSTRSAVTGNPFDTPAYARYRLALGDEPFRVDVGGEGADGGSWLGFFRTGRLRRTADIPSSPANPDAARWWAMVEALRIQGVGDIRLNTFASPEGAGWPAAAAGDADPAAAGNPAWRVDARARTEFVLDLNTRPALSSNHRRNARRGAAAGLTLLEAGRPEHHALLTGHSMSRRRGRGEAVGTGVAAGDVRAMVDAGAAQLFQAILNTEAVSSILVLHSATTAYYHSAGTSREGMAAGASHWLLNEVLNTLGGRGLNTFNLGGANPGNDGLRRFKEGFGARPRTTTAARLRGSGVLSAWLRRLRSDMRGA